jgi:hypothetical protein
VAANLFRASKRLRVTLVDELRFGELLDKAKQGSNLMIQKITEYLCRKRRINDILGILIPCKQYPVIHTSATRRPFDYDSHK